MLICVVLMLPASLTFLPAWPTSDRARFRGLVDVCQRRRCREVLAMFGALGLGVVVALGLLLV